MITIQKSIDLAEFYKSKILNVYSAISYVYEQSGTKDILKAINISKIESFDDTELNQLLTIEKREQLKVKQTSSEMIQAIIEADKIYRLDLNFGKEVTNVENVGNGAKKVTVQLNNAMIVHSFYTEVVQEMLNDLEIFALHFEHGTADETAVYQSLHQTYLEIVQTMYYQIATANKTVEARYYTNIIDLYLKWNKRKEKGTIEVVNQIRKNTNKGTVVNKNLD